MVEFDKILERLPIHMSSIDDLDPRLEKVGIFPLGNYASIVLHRMHISFYCDAIVTLCICGCP